MWIWSDVGPVLPWVITSVSVAYVAYIHYKLRKQLKQCDPDQCKVNPAIDKHLGKVRHVFKGDHLEKEDETQDSNGNKSEAKTIATDIEDEGEKESEGRPRGRRSAYSYFVANCAEREDNPLCHTSGERRIFAEFAKKCAHNWKKLSEEEKQHFHSLSEEDRHRYEREMKTYRKEHHKPHSHKSRNSSSSSKSKKICAKKVSEEDLTDDNLLNMAFDMYATEEMPLVRGQRPSIADINEEVLTELLKRWNHSDQEFKDQYLDRIRHQSVAFNMSFNQSIRDDDESGAGAGDQPSAAVERENTPEFCEDSPEEAIICCTDGVNCGSDEEFGQEVNGTDGKRLSLCRCWRSETFPYCDGAHKQYNRQFNDNVGPVNIEWSPEEETEPKTIVEDIPSMNASTELSSLEMIDSNGDNGSAGSSREDTHSFDDNNDFN